MPITINGTGSISGVTAGGLPSASVTSATIADANITATKLDGAQSGSAPIYGCRAWVNFDGTKDTTGATSTANTNRLIRASGNVASVARTGTGQYTVNLTTAMPDSNGSASCSAAGIANTGQPIRHGVEITSTSEIVVRTQDNNGTNADYGNIYVQLFR